jgi:AraC-like DNA-binding protein
MVWGRTLSSGHAGHGRTRSTSSAKAYSPGDVTGVGYRVGYDSPSQFSREYRRLFGAPPSLDAVRLRGGAGPAAAALP